MTGELALRGRLFRFAAVGVVACVVDMAVVEALVRTGAVGPYAARAASYLAAATVAWRLNRSFTFAGRTSSSMLSEWGVYLATNLAGGAVNYAVYAALVASLPIVAAYPSLGVIVGSLAGMSMNFAASSALVFRKGRERPTC